MTEIKPPTASARPESRQATILTSTPERFSDNPLRDLREILKVVRAIVEVPFQAHKRQGLQSAASRSLLLMLEDARLALIPFLGAESAPQNGGVHLMEFHNILTQIGRDEKFKPILDTLKFSGESLPAINRGAAPLRAALGGFPLRNVIEFLASLAADTSTSFVVGTNTTASSLRSIVPGQKLAPARFDIRDSKVVLVKNQSSSNEEDRKNIAAAKSALLVGGDRIIRELQQSNCDKRLLESIQDLQQQLGGEVDAIKMGLANFSCEVMVSAFELELPAAVASMLKAHTHGVQLFVGQYPEWNQFLENAASTEIGSAEVSQLYRDAKEFISDLALRPDLIDPEVPKILSFLNDLIAKPSGTAKRAAYALARSLENFVSSILTHSADLADKTVKKTVETGSTVASKVVVALLVYALTGTTVIEPLAAKVQGMSWVQSASEIVKRVLNEAAK